MIGLELGVGRVELSSLASVVSLAQKLADLEEEVESVQELLQEASGDKEMEEEIDENENWTNILLVENFPEANRAEKFQYMFETKKGCVSVKYIEEKNIGIVEFERNKDAKAVLDELNGFKMTDTHILKISYMKRIGE